MSRWQEQFDNHPFQQVWKNLKDIVEETKVDDESIITNVEELARLIRVIGYVDALIEASDPELVPLATWQNFQSQCQACLQETTNYKNNRNIQHLVNANANVDNLLTYVRPYVVESGKAAKAAQTAFRGYSVVIAEGLENFKNQATEYLDEFQEYRSSTLEKYNELKELHTQIAALKQQYFEGTETEEAIESRVNSMFTTIGDHYSKIDEYHTELLDSGSDSIMEKIAEAKEDSEKNKESIETMLHDADKQLHALKLFYKDVHGSADEEGNITGGLKFELEDRRKELDTFKTKQQEKYLALNSQIEELLPGATSAGLAAAYRAMRRSFAKPIKQYSILFYVSIIILSITAFISTIDSIWTANEFIKFVDVTDIKNLMSNLTHKLPIILPVLWLALFASKRRSEAQRLQQEYAHKEALAKSYQNFKNQVDSLGGDKKEVLLEKLLGAAIDAVASNASDTLDKAHGDKTPAHEGLDKTVSSLEKIKGMFK
jgi:hypothetical protein